MKREAIRFFAYPLVLILASSIAIAEEITSAVGNSPSAQARLDFQINVGKVLFFGIGSGTSTSSTFPTASTSINSVALNLTDSGTITEGNNIAVNWDGTVPNLPLTSNAVSLPVQVSCNTGNVSLSATVNAPLSNTSGTTVPFSKIGITSSDNNFPAPTIPDSGTGSSVSIPGSHSGGLVTMRNADWTFTVNSPSGLPGGSFHGQLLFTAISL